MLPIMTAVLSKTIHGSVVAKMTYSPYASDSRRRFTTQCIQQFSNAPTTSVWALFLFAFLPLERFA